MPESDDLKSSIKDPVKNVANEVVSDIVYRITRAGSRRAINELKKELKDKSFRKLQKKIESMSEEKIDRLLEKDADKVISRITESGAERRQLIREIEREFRQDFKKTLHRVVKVSRLAIIVTAAVLIVGTGIAFAATRGNLGNADTIAPKVELYLSSEAPLPGEVVTFVVEAHDETGVDWIELLINGEVVSEGDTSPLVFRGGPFPEGATVRYSAFVYDEAGNEGFSGERFLRIFAPPPEANPDLVIIEVWHEWANIDAGQVVIHYAIQNRGDGKAGSSLTVLRLGGDIIGREVVGSLEPGEISEREFPVIEASPKRFTVNVCTDFQNEVIEADEFNNCTDYTYVG